jgi:hypothetical protein
MAQGKAFTDEQRNVIIESLRPYLEMGLSRNRACSLIGLHPSTLSIWLGEDEALSIKIQAWENAMNVLATANIKSALEKEAEMDDTKKETSKWWAERRMKEDFSTKTEVDQRVEGQLGVIQIPQKNANTLETPAETGDSTS